MRLPLLAVLLTLGLNLAGQTMRFSHLDQKQGLSQNTATAFLQDAEGFIWVGTQDGLNRYDGYTFSVFRTAPGDTNSLSDNFILSLAEDADGNIWVGTRNGLCVYQKSSAKFYRFYSDAEDRKQFHANIRHLAAVNGGGIIYRTLSGQLFAVTLTSDPGPKRFTSSLLRDSVSLFSYCAESNQVAYMKRGVIHFFTPGEQDQSLRYAWTPVTRGAPTLLLTEKLLYINDSLVVWSYPVWANAERTEVCRSHAKINVMTMDQDRTLWMGTENGIVQCPDMTQYGIVTYENKSDYFSLHGSRVESIYRSKENIMWIGTVGGINIYDPLQTRFKTMYGHFPLRNDDKPTWFVLACGSTVLWAGDDGLSYETRGNSAWPWLKLIPPDLLYSAGCFDSRGRLWLGTKNQGIVIVDTANKTVEKKFLTSPDYRSSAILDIRPGGRGKMWIAAIGSLSTITESDLAVHFIAGLRNAHGIKSRYFSALAPDENGNMYVATASGLMHFDATDSAYVLYTNDPGDANSLCYNILNDIELIDGKLWIASMGSGLDRFDPATNTFTHYTTRDGLANNTIYGIERDRDGKLWLSTNEGLVVLDPVTGTSRNYTMRDGLPSNEFVINKHSQNAANGTLYFGSASGPVTFNPQELKTVAPGVYPVITRLLVNYKNHLFASDSVLRLSPDEKNITVEFTAIDFRNQDKIRYEYRLDGFDTAWHSSEAANRLAVYTNLPYGQYTFQVRYKISGESWSENILQLKIIIETPFYAMTWFRVLILAGIVIVTGLIVRYISQRKLRKQLEALQVQEKIRNEKERISRDLHDNVGAQLTYVISSLDNLSFRLDKHPSAGAESERIGELSEFARGTMDQLRESIWAINSGQISLSELTGRWKQYVSQLSETNASFSGKVERQGEDLVINPAVAIEIHRIVQEAITNAFRHSSGTQLHVMVNYNGAVLNVHVRDNGCGLPVTPEKEGHYGLQNMRQRAKLANAELTFESGEEGTTVHLVWSNNQEGWP